MTKNTLILGALILLMGGNAYAEWSNQLKIIDIESSDVNVAGVWLRFNVEAIPGHTCSNRLGQYLLGGGSDNVKQMAALAISAMLAARPVQVYWAGACGANGYPVIQGLTLK